MSAPSTSRNTFLALLLSLVASFLLTTIYAFYPLLFTIVSGLIGSHGGAGSGGVGVVAGGVGESFLWVLLLAEPIIFLLIFALLQRRRVLS